MLETVTDQDRDRARSHGPAMPATIEPAECTDVPPLTVTMSGGRIVLVPRADLDRDDTIVFAHAMDAALVTGAGVLVELDRSADVDRHLDAIELDRPEAALCASRPCAGCDGTRSVTVIAAGVIGLAATGSWWIVDLLRCRFTRTIGPVDIRFLGEEAWSDLTALWVTSGVTRALTHTGSFVTDSCGEASLRAS